jgi:hypothetical protein
MCGFLVVFGFGSPGAEDAEDIAAVDAVACDERWCRTRVRKGRAACYQVDTAGVMPIVAEFSSRSRPWWRLSVVPVELGRT